MEESTFCDDGNAGLYVIFCSHCVLVFSQGILTDGNYKNKLQQLV